MATKVDPPTRQWSEWDRETVRTALTSTVTDSNLLIQASLDQEVGRLEAKITGDTLVIEKIEIAPEVVVKGKGFFSKSNTTAGHGRGYGTMLIRGVQAFARRRGLHAITGSVSAQDLKANRYLLEWYSRRGFITERVAAPGVAGSAATYRMLL